MLKVKGVRPFAMFACTLVLFALQVGLAASYRILMMPIHMQSHASCMASIAVELAARGHQVHMVFGKEFHPLPAELKSSLSSVIVERYERPELNSTVDFDAVNGNISRMILEDRAGPGEVLSYTLPLFAVECRRLLMLNEPLMSHLAALNFDMAVVDGLFVFKCLYLVPHRLQIPWVTMTDSFEPWLAKVPWLPSFVPNPIVPFTEKMTFVERLQNSFWTALMASVSIVPDPPEDILAKYRLYGHFDTLNDLAAKSQLWITTSDLSLDYAKPSMPNVVEAAGLTTKPSTKELPESIKTFADSSRKGLILVSFGSIVSTFPAAMAEKFTSAFSALKDYNIIWRFQKQDQMKLPENILALNWIPQNDILAHPRTKLFITHCGNNGQYESLYHGVPMIGFPTNGDQPYNAKRIVHKGFGLTMDIHDFTAEELLSNINRILSDNTFKEKISKASEIYRSSYQTSREKAAWWIEHVAKFGGDHLRSAGNDLALYQYLMIDVLVFLFVVAISFFICTWKTMRFILKKVLKWNKHEYKEKRQ